MVGSRENHDGSDSASHVDRRRHKTPLFGETKGRIIKGGIVLAAVVLVVVLLMMVTSSRSKARFVLSASEIQEVSADVQSQTTYDVGSKIFFLVNKRNGKSLNASHFVIEISREDGGKPGAQKQISYEIDKEFGKVSAYIPVEYFSRPGKYRVKSFLDGKPVTSDEVDIR